jgi:hypothetical protein
VTFGNDHFDMRCSALAVTAVVLAECGGLKPVPPIDRGERDELTRLCTRLEAVTVRLRTESKDDATAVDYYVSALTAAGFHAVGEGDASTSTGPTASIEDVSDRTKQEGTWTYLTLGIVPTYATTLASYMVRATDELGHVSTASFDERTSLVFGWLGLPFALLPGWTSLGESAFWGPKIALRDRPGDRLALCVARAVADLESRR